MKVSPFFVDLTGVGGVSLELLVLSELLLRGVALPAEKVLLVLWEWWGIELCGVVRVVFMLSWIVEGASRFS